MKVMNQLDSLFLSNPMLIEITRFRRKFFSIKGSNAANSGVLALLALTYGGLVILVAKYCKDIPPISIVLAQTFVLSILGPMMLHSAISGERERRTWDLLLVAPVTKGQIVAGKLVGALSVLSTMAIAFGIPIAICSIGYTHSTPAYYLFLSELVSLSFGILVCSYSILVSARVKRSFMSLGITLASVILGTAIIPAFGEMLANGDPFIRGLVEYPNPFVCIGNFMRFLDGNNLQQFETIPIAAYGWTHALMYLGLASAFFFWATNTLNFPENEVKFLPKSQDHA